MTDQNFERGVLDRYSLAWIALSLVTGLLVCGALIFLHQSNEDATLEAVNLIRDFRLARIDLLDASLRFHLSEDELKGEYRQAAAQALLEQSVREFRASLPNLPEGSEMADKFEQTLREFSAVMADSVQAAQDTGFSLKQLALLNQLSQQSAVVDQELRARLVAVMDRGENRFRLLIIAAATLMLIIVFGTMNSMERHLTALRNLDASEVKAGRMFELAPIPLGLMSKDGKLVMVNAAYKHSFGYSVDDVGDIDTWMLKAYPDPDYRAEVISHWSEAVGKAAPTNSVIPPEEYRVTCKDGRVRRVLLSGFDVGDGMLAAFLDVTDLRSAEDALRAEQHRLELLIDHAPAALALFDRDMKYMAVSRRWIEDYQLGDADLIGKSHYEVFPDLPPHWREIHSQALAGDVKKFEQDTYVRANGTTLWLRWEARPWHEPGGAIGGIVLFTEDISAQVKSSLALKESEDRFRAITEQAVVGVCVIGDDGTFRYANPMLATMLACPVEPGLQGRSVLDFVLPADHAAIGQLLQRRLQHSGSPERSTFTVVRADGVHARFEETGSVGVFEGKQAIFSSVRDVTELERAEQQLRENEARLREILDQSISGVFVVQDGKVVYVNSRLREMFGASANGVFDPDPLAHVSPEDRGRVIEAMKSDINAQMSDGLGVIVYTALRKDGTTFRIGVKAGRAMFDGRPAILATAEDVTEKEHAEQKIASYITRLEKATMGAVGVIETISEIRDPYTRGHERRTAEIAVAIATELALPPEKIEGIRIASHLHDVGQIGIPADILSKPARLSPPEFALVKQHAQSSYDILKAFDFPWPVAEIARQHHERMDGSGYPQGLRGDQILQEARIIAVADTIEAMMSHRPYRPALGLEKALAEIETHRGVLYDSDAVDACLRLFREKGYVVPA